MRAVFDPIGQVPENERPMEAPPSTQPKEEDPYGEFLKDFQPTISLLIPLVIGWLLITGVWAVLMTYREQPLWTVLFVLATLVVGVSMGAVLLAVSVEDLPEEPLWWRFVCMTFAGISFLTIASIHYPFYRLSHYLDGVAQAILDDINQEEESPKTLREYLDEAQFTDRRD